MAALLFVPAGTLRFWQAWVFLALVVVPTLYSLHHLYLHKPKLLERRLQRKERYKQQKIFQIAWTLIFFASFIVAGLERRFGWSLTFVGPMPLWINVIAQAFVFAGVLLTIRVMLTNEYASRIIEVELGQTLVSSGPYSVVRHPMYSGILLQMVATPFALGSYLAVPLFALLIPVMAFRLLHEERVLSKDLPGYREYCERVRFRLVPRVW